MPQTIKIVIPMAGFGSRMRPQTWSRPKPLLALAGKTLLDYALQQFDTLPAAYTREYVFITGPQGDQVRQHMQKHHPGVKVHYLLQAEMRGQSHALHLAKEHLTGPMLMAFCDTLIETDLAFLASEALDGVTWVKPVPDPRRFGAAELGPDGLVANLIEKPQDITKNLVLVGFYYFREGADLVAAIEEQVRRGVSLKGEYFLADAVNIWLEKGNRMRVERIETWLDAGIPDTVLETNRYLLEHGAENSAVAARPGVEIIPPVFIHPSATVEESSIGPHVSIGAGCVLKNAMLRNTVVDEHCHVHNARLGSSLLGRRVTVTGSGTGDWFSVHLGDDAWIKS